MSVVIVSGLAPKTTKHSVEAFLSFCGAIDDIQLVDESAEVTFAAPTGASNAILFVPVTVSANLLTSLPICPRCRLNGGQLEGSTISVAAASSPEPAAPTPEAAPPAAGDDKPVHEVKQEDKPKAAIVSELLAHGYLLSDEATKRALDLDKKHGYSGKFSSFLTDLDRSLGAKYPAPPASIPPGNTEEEGAREVNSAPAPSSVTAEDPSFVANVQTSVQQQLSDPKSLLSRANTVWHGPHVGYAWSKLGTFYNSAANHPKIQQFYASSSRTIQDVHSQAKVIAQEKKAAQARASP